MYRVNYFSLTSMDDDGTRDYVMNTLECEDEDLDQVCEMIGKEDIFNMVHFDIRLEDYRKKV